MSGVVRVREMQRTKSPMGWNTEIVVVETPYALMNVHQVENEKEIPKETPVAPLTWFGLAGKLLRELINKVKKQSCEDG